MYFADILLEQRLQFIERVKCEQKNQLILTLGVFQDLRIDKCQKII